LGELPRYAEVRSTDLGQGVQAASAGSTGKSVQAGYRALFQGAVQAIRNPAAHEPLKPLSTEEAMELLTLASLLNRALDTATPKDGTGKG
jgi:uncharacterized protein (TIGR02391 family)